MIFTPATFFLWGVANREGAHDRGSLRLAQNGTTHIAGVWQGANASCGKQNMLLVVKTRISFESSRLQRSRIVCSNTVLLKKVHVYFAGHFRVNQIQEWTISPVVIVSFGNVIKFLFEGAEVVWNTWVWPRWWSLPVGSSCNELPMFAWSELGARCLCRRNNRFILYSFWFRYQLASES